MSFVLATEAERRDAILWCYRLFLDRNPESAGALASFLSVDTTGELRRLFLASQEYLSGRPEDHASPNTVPLTHAPNSVDLPSDSDTAERLLRHVERTWCRLGNEAPHWSVLSSDQFRPERIAETEVQFYASGDTDAELVLAVLARHSLRPADLPHCFEFGCGLGRVTLALAKHFPRVTGCDISASHLATARRRLMQFSIPNVELIQATASDLGMDRPFDLWFSRIVLQHNPPPIMRRILDRAFSLLSPGGVAVFQLPTWAEGYGFDAGVYLQELNADSGIEMHCLPQHEVFTLAASHGLTPLEVREEYSTGPARYWISNLFVFRRSRRNSDGT